MRKKQQKKETGAGISGTFKQLARRERDMDIVSKYTSLREEYPDLKSQRLFEEIANNYPISTAAIRAICVKHGVCSQVSRK